MYQALKRKIQVGVALYQLLELYNWTCENRLETSWVKLYNLKRISLKKSIMTVSKLYSDNTRNIQTLHEMKLYWSPVGEQNCIHGMVHGAGRTEDIQNNIEY